MKYVHSLFISSESSLVSAAHFHYTNLPFVRLLSSACYVARQPTGEPNSVKKDFTLWL